MKKRGSALLVVIIIMFFVFLMAAIMVQMTIRSRVNSKSDINDTNAYYCAEAGVNNTINYLSNLASADLNSYKIGDINSVSQLNVFDNSSSYQATFKVLSKGTGSPPGNVIFEINSTGTYGQTEYIIEAEIQLDLIVAKNQYKFSKFIWKKTIK